MLTTSIARPSRILKFDLFTASVCMLRSRWQIKDKLEYKPNFKEMRREIATVMCHLHSCRT